MMWNKRKEVSGMVDEEEMIHVPAGSFYRGVHTTADDVAQSTAKESQQ